MLMNQIANPGIDTEVPVLKYRHANDSRHAVSNVMMIPSMMGGSFIAEQISRQDVEKQRVTRSNVAGSARGTSPPSI
jgi:hypothetical protein